MTRILKAVIFVGAVLGLAVLPACSTATPTDTPTATAQPSPDLDAVRTEAAADVWAQVTQTLAAQVSPTLTPTFPPINTVPATATQPPLSAPGSVTGVPSGTPNLIASAPPGSVTGVPSTTPDPAIANRAQWVSQSVADGTVMDPGETFTMTWQLKNIGAATWTATYLLRFYSGNPLGATQEILLGRVVPPGELLEVSIPMQAPTVPGDYRTDWVLSTEERINFKEPVFLKFSVVSAATPTRTPTP